MSNLSKTLSRYMKQPHLLPGRVNRWFRCWRINRNASISVSYEAYIAPTAQLQLSPGLQNYGGSINVARGCALLDGVLLIPFGGSIEIEEGVYIGPYCVLEGHGGLKIGRGTMIAGHTFVIPANHSFEDRDAPVTSQPLSTKGIAIGEGVWIGCGVQILDGVTIGRGCVVGAGSVVTKSLPDYAIALGVPAKVVRYRGSRNSITSHAVLSETNGSHTP